MQLEEVSREDNGSWRRRFWKTALGRDGSSKMAKAEMNRPKEAVEAQTVSAENQEAVTTTERKQEKLDAANSSSGASNAGERKCPTCRAIFARKRGLANHMLLHRDKTVYVQSETRHQQSNSSSTPRPVIFMYPL